MIVEPWKYWTQCKWWNNEELRKDNLVPDSCCRTQTPHCGKRDHPSNIYRSGKDKKIFFDINLFILIGNKYATLNYNIFNNCRLYQSSRENRKRSLDYCGCLGNWNMFSTADWYNTSMRSPVQIKKNIPLWIICLQGFQA